MRKIILFLVGFILVLSTIVTSPAAAVTGAPLAWEYLAPLGSARFNHTAALLSDGRILVMGGTQGGDTYLSSAAVYDPLSGSWTTVAAMNYARVGHTATTLPDGRVLVSGGKGMSGIGFADYLNNAEIYDPVTDLWSLLPVFMQSPRQYHTATLLADGRVLLVGGQTALLTVSASAETFDPMTDTFTSVGNLPDNRARRDHTATRLPNGEVLIVGGQTILTSPPSFTNTTALFDPLTNSFRAGASFSGARGNHTATLLNNDKVMVTGGRYYFLSAFAYRDDVQFYDPAADSWSSGTSFNTARAYHHVSLLPNGTLMLSGGYNGSALSDSQIYDVDVDSWSAASAFNQSRYRYTAVLLPSGSLVALGGYDGTDARASVERFDPPNGFKSPAATRTNPLTPGTANVLPNGKVLLTGLRVVDQNTDGTEIYDPELNTWSAHTPMNQIRRYHTATLLADGRLLVVGGMGETNQSVNLNTAEIYDPVEETWTMAASMHDARANHTATLMADGRVLVVGGSIRDMTLPAVPSAEIYDPRSDHWSITGSPIQSRYYHEALLLTDGRVMIAGGIRKENSSSLHPINTVELFDPITQTWANGAPMSNEENNDYGKYNFTMNLLPDGKVLVTGGVSGIIYYARIERYNPTTDTWTSLGLLPTKRAEHAATMMGDGRLLISGGVYQNSGDPGTIYYYCDEYLIFDPATATITLASSMVSTRAYHKSVLLPNGRVMLISGSSPELYTSGIGFAQAWRPKVDQISPLQIGEPLSLTGEQFFGYGFTEASSGGTQSVSSGHPLVLLYSLGNEQITWLTPDPANGFTPTSYNSLPISDFPVGPTYAIMYTNGIASQPVFLSMEMEIENFAIYLPLLIR